MAGGRGIMAGGRGKELGRGGGGMKY